MLAGAGTTIAFLFVLYLAIKHDKAVFERTTTNAICLKTAIDKEDPDLAEIDSYLHSHLPTRQDPRMLYSNGDTIFMRAAKLGHTEACRLILKFHYQLDAEELKWITVSYEQES